MEVVFTRWDELVGAEFGGASAPMRVQGRVLVVAVEHPAWATRARMESGQILARLRELGDTTDRPPRGGRPAPLNDTRWPQRRPFRGAEYGAAVG